MLWSRVSWSPVFIHPIRIGKREAPLADTFPIPIGLSVSYFNNNSVVPRTFFGFKGCLKMIARSFFPCGRKVQRDVKPHAI